MASDSDTKPPYTQLRKGRWYWEPPLRLRRSHKLEVRPLGPDQVRAWEFARRLNKELAGLEENTSVPGTVRWLFDQFFAGERFMSLAVATQRDYRWLAKTICGIEMGAITCGRLQAKAIKPRHADKLYLILKEQSGHSGAHYACRFARRVWKWGGRREFVDAHPNPWSGMELASLPQRNDRWHPDQINAVISMAREKGVPSIALAVVVAYWIGHRQADVLGLTWGMIEAGERETAKTGAMVPIVVAAYPDLDRALADEYVRQGWPDDGIVIRHEGTGAQWNRFTFNHEFRRIARLAGIPDKLQFRDLRATAHTELADGGASMIGMRTHGGHKTMQMMGRYARPTAAQFEEAAAMRIAGNNKALAK